MKFFAGAKILKKIAIIFTLITTLFFAAPKPVEASIGGDLMKPICSFIVGLGDGVLDVIHTTMIKSGRSLIRINLKKDFFEILRIIIGSIIVCCLVVAAIIMTAGTGASVLAPLGAVISKFAVGGTIFTLLKGVGMCAAIGAGIFASVWVYDTGIWENDEVVLPLYSITPEEIFKNDETFPLLSVNFFKKDRRFIKYEYKVVNTVKNTTTETLTDEEVQAIHNSNGGYAESEEDTVADWVKNLTYKNVMEDTDNYPDISSELALDDPTDYLSTQNLAEQALRLISLQITDGEDEYYLSYGDFSETDTYLTNGQVTNNGNNLPNNYNKRDLYVKKDNKIYWLVEDTNLGYKIFVGDIPSDHKDDPINKEAVVHNQTHYFTPTGGDYIEEQIEETKVDRIYPISTRISDYVMSGYVALRTMAAVGMMTVLVYIGIRIIISSTSTQKAKYKQMLGDWLVGMILLFTMNYIMTFANACVDELSNFLNTINVGVYPQIIEDEDGKIEKALKDMGYDTESNVKDYSGNSSANASSNIDAKTLSENIRDKKITKYIFTDKNGDNHTYIEWYTNLMGTLRVRANFNGKGDAVDYIGYSLMFAVMVILTVTFLWTYIKRIIYLAFLTFIAPIVALTYPIDKVNDGKAQGFNFWLREYIFNLLLQPMHLLIYTILVGGAIELASTNVLYSLVAIGFIASAERIIRKMFNFQKAKTPGVFAGAGASLMTMSGVKFLTSLGPNGQKKRNPKDNEKEQHLYTSKQGSRRVEEGLNDFVLGTEEYSEHPTNPNEEKARSHINGDEDDIDTEYIEFLDDDQQIQYRRHKGTYTKPQGIEEIPEGEDIDFIDDDESFTYYSGKDFEDEADNITFENSGEDSDYDEDNKTYRNADEVIDEEDDETDIFAIGGSVIDEENEDEIEYEDEEDADEEEIKLIDIMDYSDDETIEYIKEKAEDESLRGIQDGEYTTLYNYLMLLDPDGKERKELLKLFREEESTKWKLKTKGERKRKIKNLGVKVKNGAIFGVSKVAGGAAGITKGIAGVEQSFYDKQNERFTRSTKNGVKTLTGIATAATAGMIGMAAGIASGNPSQVLQNTTIAGAGGYKLGKGIGSTVESSLKDSREAYSRAKLGEEKYAEKKAKEYQRQIAENPATIRLIQRNMHVSRREAINLAKQMVPEYMDVKVTDVKEMIKLEKFRTNNENIFKDRKGHHRSLLRSEVAQLPRMQKIYGIKAEDEEDKKEAIKNSMMEGMKINEKTAIRFQELTREYVAFDEEATETKYQEKDTKVQKTLTQAQTQTTTQQDNRQDDIDSIIPISEKKKSDETSEESGIKELIEVARKKYEKQLQQDDETIRLIQSKFHITKREAKEKAKEMIPEYLKQDVTDVKEMIKLEKFMEITGRYKDSKGHTRTLLRSEVAKLPRIERTYNAKQNKTENKSTSIAGKKKKENKNTNIAGKKLDERGIDEEELANFQNIARLYRSFKDI